MTYTNSSLISATYLSPNYYTGRQSIEGITPHCYVGKASLASAGAWFGKSSTQASSNYYIDEYGKIALIVAEMNGAWTSSSYKNDMTHVTIECASEATAPYKLPDATYEALIKLTADIYKRNGIKTATWNNDKNNPGNITVHRWFKPSKSCPGDWLMAKLNSGEFTQRVNALLNGSSTGEENEEMALECLFKVNGGNTVFYCDGQRVVALSHPDQMKLIQNNYKKQTGKDIPYYTSWTSKNPWYNRLMQVINKTSITTEFDVNKKY